jgi:ATP-dependent exoDNAse (exonuclease V) alpha subunit
MAQYRFSAQVISRSTGRSSVAAAAYRAGQDLTDERTGLDHDFARRQGVLSAEIIAPDHAPEWVHDRSRLWNAIEAIETRSNSQLAREIQFSLPHELDDAGRRELLHDFVREQFVSRGMVADVAIHRPDRDGDNRNHHAHVMLTMREITREGFHPTKSTPTARGWNAKENVELWRELWAQHQNRALERGGHADRVDHRSLEARGIDREPTQHMGPIAHGMEKHGRPSRIGDKNRETDDRNDARADDHRKAAIIDLAAERAKRRPHEPQRSPETAPRASIAWDQRKHADERDMLEASLSETYGERQATLNEARARYASRLATTGWRKLWRNLTGKTRADEIRLRQTERALASIERATTRQREALEQRQQMAIAVRERQEAPAPVRDHWAAAAAPAAPLRDYWRDVADPPTQPVERDYWSGESSPARNDGPASDDRSGPER